jgi:hypothetical protein
MSVQEMVPSDIGDQSFTTFSFVEESIAVTASISRYRLEVYFINVFLGSVGLLPVYTFQLPKLAPGQIVERIDSNPISSSSPPDASIIFTILIRCVDGSRVTAKFALHRQSIIEKAGTIPYGTDLQWNEWSSMTSLVEDLSGSNATCDFSGIYLGSANKTTDNSKNRRLEIRRFIGPLPPSPFSYPRPFTQGKVPGKVFCEEVLAPPPATVTVVDNILPFEFIILDDYGRFLGVKASF